MADVSRANSKLPAKLPTKDKLKQNEDDHLIGKKPANGQQAEKSLQPPRLLITSKERKLMRNSVVRSVPRLQEKENLNVKRCVGSDEQMSSSAHLAEDQ
ncbi:unnamed protein product [Cyprideis torosa]|uniref:Uncharacterized protein n=1 Tax=Cyprideis torosa TaxID=163714 RepID=A0A7R8ZSJ4_9CRUS|nr:unnamed protein product [Cyprideis torosa]CAG0906010.1 unnamed protein product [Cyprideis torosa]